MKETYPLVAESNPSLKGSEIIKKVSSMWRDMTTEEVRLVYFYNINVTFNFTNSPINYLVFITICI